MTALENMAAAARPPGLGDARVPCPLCGGLVHPVAGRCKHCKADLSAFRAGRPQAAAPLPSLVAAPPAVPLVGATSLPGGTTIHAPVPVAAITQREGSQPILPQRPTGRSMAAQSAGGSMWKSWPMLVIGVAVLAIVTAVVIMVLPQDAKASHKKIGAPPPAPERMDLDPMPPKSSQITPPSGSDPWAAPDYAGPQQVQPPTPSPAQPDPNDPDDLFNGLSNTMGGMELNVAKHVCENLKKCPGSSSSMLSSVCNTVEQQTIAPPTCDAAKRCLDDVDALPCATTISASDVLGVSMTVQSCIAAMNDC